MVLKDKWIFTPVENGAIGDFLGKHALLTRLSMNVVFSGEMRFFANTERGKKVLQIDNGSGSYDCSSDFLPQVEILLEKLIQGLSVMSLVSKKRVDFSQRKQAEAYSTLGALRVGLKWQRLAMFGMGTSKNYSGCGMKEDVIGAVKCWTSILSPGSRCFENLDAEDCLQSEERVLISCAPSITA